MLNTLINKNSAGQVCNGSLHHSAQTRQSHSINAISHKDSTVKMDCNRSELIQNRVSNECQSNKPDANWNGHIITETIEDVLNIERPKLKPKLLLS